MRLPQPGSVLSSGSDRIDTLRRDEEFVLFRCMVGEDSLPVLMLAPATERPPPRVLERLKHEYSLRERLEPAWAAKPRALADEDGRTVLLLDDPGTELLSGLLGRPWGTGPFLRVAVSIAGVIGRVHAQGLIHRDIKPDHLFVDMASGAAWLTGFGIASRPERERQTPDLPEMIAQTLAYMAPEQTGRMNRSVDARSDLYSFGVILYEMLTGTLPFQASEPMQWVHCHIARQPTPPSERLHSIPETVSALVLKLLAKNAEDRYQTAAGVETDLRRCLSEWQSVGRIEPFALVARDVPDRLLIPERLYGRGREVAILVDAFEQFVRGGKQALVLVSGYSGVGKSSIVNELQQAVMRARGLFASGKFEPHERDIPFAPIVRALPRRHPLDPDLERRRPPAVARRPPASARRKRPACHRPGSRSRAGYWPSAARRRGSGATGPSTLPSDPATLRGRVRATRASVRAVRG
jgi:hypothetical protein